MNTYWLLFKTQRRSLLICASLCFLAMFLLVFPDMRPEDVDDAAWIHSFSLGLALVLACLAGFHTALFKLPFPVTHRQLAWIPTLWMAVLWAAGFAGALVSIEVLSFVDGRAYALPRWTPIFLVVLKTVPFAFLMFAMVDRLIRYLGLTALACVYFFFIGAQSEVLGRAVAVYEYGWPLCVVLGIFFILEGPAHIAAMEYPFRTRLGLANMNLNVRPPGGPFRAPAIKIWADLLMALICLLAVIWYFFWILDAIPGLVRSPTVIKIFWAWIGVAALFCIRSAWQSTHANGFSAGKTFVVFLLQCSLVLLPIAWVLGAKRGTVARCVQCRHYKFLWARRCPNCGHCNQGDVVRVLLLPFWKKDKGQSFKEKRVLTPLRLLYRVQLPVLLVMFSFINFGAQFRSETIVLRPPQEGLQTDPGPSFAEVEEYLASVHDVGDWLDKEGALELPERFRIEVREHPRGREVRFFWLRWEEAGAVGERIKTRISEAFPNAGFDDGVDRGRYRARVYRPALPSFLDGGIHWITP